MIRDSLRFLRASLFLAAALLLDGCSLLPWHDDESQGEVKEVPRVTADITGVDDAVAANIRAHLGLLSEACDSAPRLQDLLAAEAGDEVRRALRAQGYYSPEVRTSLERAGQACPLLQVDVTPGPRVQLTDVDLRLAGPAAEDPRFEAYLDTLPLQPNTPLDHGVYRSTKSRIETWAADHGYFDGRFTVHELRVQPSQQRARARLEFDSGPRYDFGDLQLTQTPEVLNEDLIRRFLEFDAETPYSSARVNAMNEALRKSDYFESIDLRPRIGGREDGKVPLDITLVPRKRFSFSAGIGFSTDETVRTRLEYLDRRFSKRGHRVVAGVRASSIAQQLSAEYRIPREHPRNEWVSMQVGMRREQVDTFDTLEAQATLSETRERPFGFVETRFLEFNRQQFDIAGVDQTAFFLTPGLRYAKTSLDDAVYPTRGYRLRAELRAASEHLASDTNVVRAIVSGAWIHSLPWRDRLLLRSDLGAMWVSEFSRLPPSLRFFAGGDSSIRGYGYQDLGPVDARGKVVGGRYLGTASAEYEHVLTDRWSVAGFVDAGNAFGGDGSDTGIKTGIGGGVRWRSPIGPIRADLVHPLDDAAQVRLHLRVGPDL